MVIVSFLSKILQRSVQINDQGRDEFSITFAPERKMNAKNLRKAVNEYNLFAPNTKDNEV